MRQRDKQPPQSAEETVRDIRRATRRHFSAEEKIRIVLDGLRGEDSIAEICRVIVERCFASTKASPRTFSIDGPRSPSKPARSRWPATPPARRRPTRSSSSAPKPASSRRRWPRSPSKTACSKKA